MSGSLRLIGILTTGLVTGSNLNGQELPRWTISPNAIELGKGADEEFESVRSGRLFPDGRAVIADTRGLFLRVYGAEGTRVASFGRRGGGPGEFGSIYAVWLTSNGKIGVWDGQSRRITNFEPDGRVISTHPVRADGKLVGHLEIYLGSFRNGDLLLSTLHWDRKWAATEPAPERWALGRFSPTGEFRGPAGEVHGMWRMHRGPLPFSPIARVVIRSDSIWLAEGYDPVLKVLNANGQVLRTIELPWRVRPSGNPRAHLENQIREAKNALYLELLREAPEPDQFPTVSGLLMDDRGQLWVKEYNPAFDKIWLKGNALNLGPGGTWHVLGTNGRWIATVRMPDNVIPLDIRGNQLLAVTRDEFDVEQVGIHTVMR